MKYTNNGAPYRVIDKAILVVRENSNNRPGHLVMSDTSGHSGDELCQSESSLGADSISIAEAVYCDMTAKEQQSLCPDRITTSCFDSTTKTKLGGTSSLQARVEATGRVTPEKFL